MSTRNFVCEYRGDIIELYNSITIFGARKKTCHLQKPIFAIKTVKICKRYSHFTISVDRPTFMFALLS